MKRTLLLTWLGKHDLDAERNQELGAIGSILMETPLPFDEVHILVQNWKEQAHQYEPWLKQTLRKQSRNTRIVLKPVELSSPIDYEAIYEIAHNQLSDLTSGDFRVTLNLTSGTPAMTAIWVLLGKGVFDCQLAQTSRQDGASKVELPFDVSIAYQQHQDARLGSIASALPSTNSEFSRIQANSAAMKECVSLAQRIAQRDIPVIIHGETGSGKEVMANAIHSGSLRAEKPFVAVNCGAIPESLIDSHLFGHKKGAFTGAVADSQGYFEVASGGTLFLDEVGELPLDAQAKLLRALQQQEIMPVGGSKPVQVDVRIVAATHRNLLSMIEDGLFREDLFYRLAVGVIGLPPLRERKEDIESLVSVLIDNLNDEAKSQPGYVGKKISKEGMEFIKSQSWPGNIRELWNTLVRASIWSDGAILDVEHLERALIQRPKKGAQAGLEFDIASGIDINEVLEKTKRYAIEQALKITAGQKGKAARLIGLSNHQTLSNWMKQLEIPDQ
ncbi:sigma 54-interacting transcriptional regulator [Pontibacterium sp.]|uniref:sigma-54 interaction domain-containing protein n=1 Tax=Pontibacterium sp. TaxID=2036026 RepID=UPI003511CC44